MFHMQEFCNIVSALRQAKGWSQTALAERLCISPQSVSKWECGVGYPDVTLFPLLAEVLEVPIGVLFGEEREADGSGRTLSSAATKKEDGPMETMTQACVWQREFPPARFIRILLGNTCRVIAGEAKKGEERIRIEAVGDPVFLRYFAVETEQDGTLTVRVKNPSGSDTYWQAYDRKGYEGENLVRINYPSSEPETDVETVNYLDLAAIGGQNREGAYEVVCKPMR